MEGRDALHRASIRTTPTNLERSAIPTLSFGVLVMIGTALYTDTIHVPRQESKPIPAKKIIPDANPIQATPLTPVSEHRILSLADDSHAALEQQLVVENQQIQEQGSPLPPSPEDLAKALDEFKNNDPKDISKVGNDAELTPETPLYITLTDGEGKHSKVCMHYVERNGRQYLQVNDRLFTVKLDLGKVIRPTPTITQTTKDNDGIYNKGSVFSGIFKQTETTPISFSDLEKIAAALTANGLKDGEEVFQYTLGDRNFIYIYEGTDQHTNMDDSNEGPEAKE